MVFPELFYDSFVTNLSSWVWVNTFLDSDNTLIKQNCDDINFLFSKDDNIVPISHLWKVQKIFSRMKIYCIWK